MHIRRVGIRRQRHWPLSASQSLLLLRERLLVPLASELLDLLLLRERLLVPLAPELLDLLLLRERLLVPLPPPLRRRRRREYFLMGLSSPLEERSPRPGWAD